MEPEITEWFEAAKNDKWGDTHESAIFSSYLSESIFVDEAAANLIAPLNDTTLPENTKVAIVWAMLFSCLEDCPSAHLHIIELIKAITSLPRPDGAGDQSVTTNQWGQSWPKFFEGLEPPFNGACSNSSLSKDAYWTDLAVFEELWRAAHDSLYDDIHEEHVSPRGSASVNHFQKWVNFQAFSAMSTNAELFQSTDWVYLCWALRCLVDGLERKPKTLKTKKWARVLTLEYRVAAACHWLIYTGRQILRNSERMSADFVGTGSELWDESKALSQSRWEFWKERIAILNDNEKLSDGTHELMRRAAVAMEKAERVVEKEKRKRGGAA